MKQGQGFGIPGGRHILLAACDRGQLANESPATQGGIFTTTLLEVLEQSGGNLSYADLFVRCRAAVRKRAQDQDPQFDLVGNFNPWTGFLGRAGGTPGRRYRVTFDQGAWKINCGAMDGVPTDADKSVGVALYDDAAPDRVVGHARTTEVGAQSSFVDLLDFQGDEGAGYSAAVTHLPVAPLLVHCPRDGEPRALLDRRARARPVDRRGAHRRARRHALRPERGARRAAPDPARNRRADPAGRTRRGQRAGGGAGDAAKPCARSRAGSAAWRCRTTPARSTPR